MPCENCEKLEAEIVEWKNASGLECGGDPDGVTPRAAEKYWTAIEADNARLREALGVILIQRHCNDTCSSELASGCACDCWKADVRAAIKATPQEGTE